MKQLRSFADPDTVVDGNAYAYASLYFGRLGFLMLFSCHAVQSGDAEKPIEYHLHQISTYGLTSDFETFVKGMSAHAALSNYAENQRKDAIAAANRKALSLSQSDISPTGLGLTPTATATEHLEIPEDDLASDSAGRSRLASRRASSRSGSSMPQSEGPTVQRSDSELAKTANRKRGRALYSS